MVAEFLLGIEGGVFGLGIDEDGGVGAVEDELDDEVGFAGAVAAEADDFAGFLVEEEFV